MTRRILRGSRAIVTGASSGIGRELALQLARRGAQLLLTARRQEQLVRLRSEIQTLGGEALVVCGDLTDDATRQNLFLAAQSVWGRVDLLVNNAGVGARGPFSTSSPERLRQIMEINFFAAVELTRVLLPLLQQGTQPIITNISSVLAHRAIPNRSEYCASKFALHGFSDSLRAELAPVGIEVLLVSPSTTGSEFSEHLLADAASSKAIGPAMSPAAVAQATIRAIERGRHEVILSTGGRLLVWVDRLCPPFADWLMAKYG